MATLRTYSTGNRQIFKTQRRERSVRRRLQRGQTTQRSLLCFSGNTHRPTTTPGLPDVAQRADLARPAARWGGPPRIPAQRVAERMAPIGAEIPWGTAGTKDCRAGPRGLAGQALTASTVLASGAVAWWPLPVVMAWSASPSVSIAILRGLAFSATGITNRSTPSR